MDMIEILYSCCEGDKPGWLKLAWQYVRRPRLDPITMIGQNRSVMGFNLIHMFERADLLGQLVDDLQALNLSPPQVGECFAFVDAQAALKKLQVKRLHSFQPSIALYVDSRPS